MIPAMSPGGYPVRGPEIKMGRKCISKPASIVSDEESLHACMIGICMNLNSRKLMMLPLLFLFSLISLIPSLHMAFSVEVCAQDKRFGIINFWVFRIQECIRKYFAHWDVPGVIVHKHVLRAIEVS